MLCGKSSKKQTRYTKEIHQSTNKKKGDSTTMASQRYPLRAPFKGARPRRNTITPSIQGSSLGQKLCPNKETIVNAQRSAASPVKTKEIHQSTRKKRRQHTDDQSEVQVENTIQGHPSNAQYR